MEKINKEQLLIRDGTPSAAGVGYAPRGDKPNKEQLLIRYGTPSDIYCNIQKKPNNVHKVPINDTRFKTNMSISSQIVSSQSNATSSNKKSSNYYMEPV